MKSLFLFLSLFALQGCGAKKLAIDYADTLIVHQITKRIPLYSDQKKELGDDVEKFLKDTKPMALEAAPLVESIEINHAKIAPQYKRFEAFYLKISDRFSGLLSRYLVKLDSTQQKKFFENLEIENKELAEREKKDIMESAEERFKYFIGSINNAQKQILVDYQDYFLNRHKSRLSAREKLLHDMKLVYADESPPEAKAKAFHAMFVTFQQKSTENNKSAEILEKIVPTMTELQKKHFHKETQEIKELLGYFVTVVY